MQPRLIDRNRPWPGPKHDPWYLTRRRAPLAALLLVLPALSGCVDQVVCGDGTIEQDGVCVGADSSKDPASCGNGTYFDPATQTCRSDNPPVRCDEGTTIEVNENGATVCVGVGGPDSCNTPLRCPPADADKVNVCGRILDVETAQPVLDQTGSSEACDPMNPAASGPCSLSLGFVDAIEFAGDPASATPLAYESLLIDGCGRFRAIGLELPSLPFVGVAIDDHPLAQAQDNYLLAGVGFRSGSGKVEEDLNLYAVSRETDQRWTESAGNPFAGQTFAQQGAYLAIFVHNRTRVPAVQLTVNGAPRPDARYFDDSVAAVIRSVADGQSATGINGAAIVVNTPLSENSGIGGQIPETCEWPSDPAASIPGGVFVQELALLDINTGEPCQ